MHCIWKHSTKCSDRTATCSITRGSRKSCRAFPTRRAVIDFCPTSHPRLEPLLSEKRSTHFAWPGEFSIARPDGAACAGGSRQCSDGGGHQRTPPECRDAAFRPWHC